LPENFRTGTIQDEYFPPLALEHMFVYTGRLVPYWHRCRQDDAVRWRMTESRPSLSGTRRARRARSRVAARDALEARFGAGVVRRLRDAPARDPADRAVPSGSVGLDRATGLGGFPRGHLTELLAPSRPARRPCSTRRSR